MSIFSFNPFKSAADITMQQLKLYNDSRSQDKLLRGTKQEVLQRWAGTTLLLQNGEVEVVPASGEYVRIREGKTEIKSYGGGSIRGRGEWRDAAWLDTNIKSLWL